MALPEDLSPFSPFIGPSTYIPIAVLFLVIGFSFTGIFLLYEFSTPTKSRVLFAELIFGFLCSVFLGIGALFTFLSVGIYV